MKLNPNPKTKRYIFLVVLLILCLTISSCDLLGGGKEDEREATQPPAAAKATQPSAEEPTPGGEKTEAPSGPSGEAGMFADPEESLDSYRMRTKMTLKEGMGMLGEEMTTEIEWVRDPEARHTTMYGASGEVMMEIIIIGDDSWTSMDGENWMHVKQTEQEEGAPFSAEDFQTSLEDIMQDMESGMKKDGKEKVNDVNCIRYTVDADFSMPFPAPEKVPEDAAQFMPKEIEGHVEGMIWVADEKSLPPVIVRSQTTQEITLKYASDKEETMVYDEERDLYDINEPITIEPPEGQVQEVPAPPVDMPTPPSGELPEPPAEAVEYASLDTLDSYRLEWSVTIKTGDMEVKSSYEMEWVKEPPACHVTMSMGEGAVLAENMWVDDTFWIKAGDTWVKGGEAEMEDALNQVGDIMTPSDDMVLMGEETVNGVRCKHYVRDESVPYSIHQEVWVANQGALPSVVVRGLDRMEMNDMVTAIEANVYDINESITIEPPQ